MKKAKALIGLATMLGLLAVGAAPALASFDSTNGQTQGKSILTPGTPAGFKISSGSPELKCPQVLDEWKIRKQDQKQEPQRKGGHLNIQAKWEQCSVEVILVKVPVEVKGCELQVEQQKLSGSVISTCVVTITTKPSCTIEVTPTGNQQLKEVTLTNVQGGLEVFSNISGITSSYPAKAGGNEKNAETCKGQLGAEGKEGTFKSKSIEGGVKVV